MLNYLFDSTVDIISSDLPSKELQPDSQGYVSNLCSNSKQRHFCQFHLIILL